MAGFDYHKKQLRERIAAREAVVIVGPDISAEAAAGSPGSPAGSWIGLLEAGIRRCTEGRLTPHGQPTQLRAEIESQKHDRLLFAGQEITTALGGPSGPTYREFLRESAGSKQVTHDSSIRALADWRIPIATTNYDGLIEHVTGLPWITWRTRAAAEPWLKGIQRAVLHLQGYWAEPESVILGRASYESARKDANAIATFRTLGAAKAVIFVGFSGGLDDSDFGPFLPWVTQALRDQGCYQIVTESDLPRFRSPEPLILTPVSYGLEQSALASFLEDLSPAAAAASKQKTVSTVRLPVLPRMRGRDRELAVAVESALSTPPKPVLVTGGPGAGKSTIAIALLHDTRIADQFGARRYFVRLDGAGDPCQVVGAVAAEIGAIETGASVSPAQLLSAVTSRLGIAPTLLVLDDLDCAWRNDRAAARELLHLLAESVPGLALAVTVSGDESDSEESWSTIRAGRLEAGPERNVFLDIAGPQYGADLHLYDLLRGIEGIPLSICLIAYTSQGEIDLKNILRQWQEQHALMLKQVPAGGELSNLDVAFEVCIQGRRMHRTARSLLSTLALLPDGAAKSDLPFLFEGPYEELDKALRSLRRAGLAYEDGHRIRLPGPIRDYVRKAYPPGAGSRDKLIDHYLKLATEGVTASATNGEAEALRRLAREGPNIEAAILMGLSPTHGGTAVKAAYSLGKLSCATGLGLTRTLTAAAEYAGTSGDLPGEADCRYRLGEVAATGGEGQAAAVYYKGALDLYERIPDPYSIGWTHLWLADLALNGAEAAKHIEAARAAWLSIGRQDQIDEYFTEA